MSLRAAVSLALWVALAAYSALIARDFYQNVDRAVYISVDDGMSNEAYALASQGRYGFLSSPVLFGLERRFGEFSYGPWYFYLSGGLIWLFGYSLTLVRSVHLWIILLSVAAASAWFRGPARAAGATAFGVTVLYAFAANQWPMVRPDSMVSLFAVALVVCAGLGLTRGGAPYWFGAGLAASCGAFTHLIASSLVVSAVILFAFGAVRQWMDTPDRPRARRALAASFTAFAAGGLLGALMFYAAFDFRFSDQIRLLTEYQVAVASTDSYATVVRQHFTMAFGYLSAEAQAGVWMLLVVSWAVVALARYLDRDSRALVIGYLVPPLTVWTCYMVSNGWYTNYHKGYGVLHDVMMAWVLAALVWLAVQLADRWSWRPARAVPVLVGVLVLALGVRQIDQQLEAAPVRSAAARQWVAIDDYVDHVLRHVPARGTAWGSLFFGIETPDRVQLIQLAEALNRLPRVAEDQRAALAPDYLLFGYPEQRDNTTIVLRGGNSLLGRLELATTASYQLTSVVTAPPYGTTRIYAKLAGGSGREPRLPEVSIFDPATQRWLSRLRPAPPVTFAPIAPAELAIGYEANPRPARASRTVSAVLPAGRYLIRVAVTAGSGRETPRLLAAHTPEQRRQQMGELGPSGDFTSYFASDRYVTLVSVHGGGALEISQFDDSPGAGIGSIDLMSVVALVDADEEPGINSLPEPATWSPTVGVRATALEAGGVVVEGDATRLGYQLTSPRIAAGAGDRVMLHVNMAVAEGRVCLGVLNGTRATWLVAPDQLRSDVTFVVDATRAFHVVPANCNEADTGNPRTRFTLWGGRYTVDARALYTDRFMDAVNATPTDPMEADIAGTVAGLIALPADLKVTRSMLEAPVEGVTPVDIVYQATIARPGGQGWTISGQAESAFSYLLTAKPRHFDANTRLIATGTIEKGGATIGLLSNNQWAAQVNVTEPGPFTVVIAAPGSGAYSVLVANALTGSLETSIVITKIGLMRAR